MAQIIRYVDPDVVGGAGDGTTWANAYSSLNACEAAENTNLDAANNYMTIYCRASLGSADSTAVIWTGWTTSATDYIEVIGSDFPSNGIYDATKYRLTANYAIQIDEEYIRFHNLQFPFTVTAAEDKKPIYIGAGTIAAASNAIWIESCIVVATVTGTATGICQGMYLADGDNNRVTNCTITGCYSADDLGNPTEWTGIYHHAGDSIIAHCTIYGNNIGIHIVNDNVFAWSCIVGNNVDDFSGAFGENKNNCSDDGDGDDPQTPSGGNWDNEMVDPGNGNFTLRANGNCVGNGRDGIHSWTDDITGRLRTSTWDIGAYEYSGGAPKYHHYQQAGGL
jgi:hypothetical protein